MSKEKEMHTKLVGVTKRNEDDEEIQELLENISDICYEGELLSLEHESDNPYDENAIKVFYGLDHIGYINRKLAEELAPLVDQQRVEAELCEVTGGEDGKSYGCNILIRIVPEGEEARTDSREFIHLSKLNIDNSSTVVDFTARPMLVDATELQSWSNEKFFSWADDFFAWCKSLPPAMNQSTFEVAQEQLQVVNKEIDRRMHNLSAMKATTVSRPINQVESKDWLDRIKPILPLVYIVWFCGIAAGTFFLLSLIFK